ncbi:MAG: hypothetical protein WCD35_00395, partial [Mycobacteriales bacterium]
MSERGNSRRGRKTLILKVASAAMGITLAGAAAFAATNWLVGLNNGSSGEARSASIANLTISAVAAPSVTNLLYPGATGDVVLNIDNQNTFPVTITGFQLPTSSTYATGYSDSALGTPNAGCTSTTSLVGWSFAAAGAASSHNLTTPLTVPASTNNFTVTLASDATMGANTPAACAGTYFSMPSFTGVTATSATTAVTPSGTTDAWTS